MSKATKSLLAKEKQKEEQSVTERRSRMENNGKKDSRNK